MTIQADQNTAIPQMRKQRWAQVESQLETAQKLLEGILEGLPSDTSNVADKLRGDLGRAFNIVGQARIAAALLAEEGE